MIFFSVLQECATDSEELIYPMRASSACSAPPDLLLTGNESQNLTTSLSTQSSSTPSGTENVTSNSAQNSAKKDTWHQAPQESISQSPAKVEKNNGMLGNKLQESQERVRLEEFTCDVSVKDGKKPQPIQFSFTLYDLDGHGKITKDVSLLF